MRISSELSRRLAPLNDTDYIYDKGLNFWMRLVKAAEKAETWEKLPKKWKSDVAKAKKYLWIPCSERKVQFGTDDSPYSIEKYLNKAKETLIDRPELSKLGRLIDNAEK